MSRQKGAFFFSFRHCGMRGVRGWMPHLGPGSTGLLASSSNPQHRPFLGCFSPDSFGLLHTFPTGPLAVGATVLEPNHFFCHSSNCICQVIMAESEIGCTQRPALLPKLSTTHLGYHSPYHNQIHPAPNLLPTSPDSS